MKRRIRYTDEPMECRVIPDFLPPAEELRKRLKRGKVAVEVDAPTVERFGKKAGGPRPDAG